MGLERKTFAPANYRMIICNSQLCKNQAMHYFRAPEEKIRVIYNGVDHSQFHPGLREKFNGVMREKFQIPEEAVVILFIARNLKRKGLQHLIKSLSLIQKGKELIKVLVVGRGNPVPFRRMADRVGWGEALIFAGESDNIFSYYGVGDILALPTLYDPFSNVCLEALACGIPIITTRENGASEIIRPGETGVVLSASADIKGLAEGISYFLPSEVRESAREKAVESARNFTIEENIRRTLGVYEQVLLMKEKSN